MKACVKGTEENLNQEKKKEKGKKRKPNSREKGVDFYFSGSFDHD